MNIKIIFRDHSVKEFKHEKRNDYPSVTLTIKYELGFVVITDVWGYTYAFPQALIAEIQTVPITW